MTSIINTPPPQPLPIICDFGWYYGISPTRLSEDSYQVGSTTYPPGATIVSPGSVSFPSSTIGVANTSSFESSGNLIVRSVAAFTQVSYTGMTSTQFTGVTGGSGTYAAGSAVYDPRFYVDQMPLQQAITFDATDHNGLGLPTVTVPAGVIIASYTWDFGNGTQGYGPYASTTYPYNQPPPSIQATLTVTDNIGRSFSCAHKLNLQTMIPVWGVAERVLSGTART